MRRRVPSRFEPAEDYPRPPHSSNGNQCLGIAEGAADGEMSGVLTGAIVWANHCPPRAWSCPDPAPGPGSAPPDSAQVPIR